MFFIVNKYLSNMYEMPDTRSSAGAVVIRETKTALWNLLAKEKKKNSEDKQIITNDELNSSKNAIFFFFKFSTFIS